ncbi:hypothetical protein IAT40_005611 [Kwoniella sp. CBS 6097]
MTADTKDAYKNIVIIGASIGGHEATNALYPCLSGDYRILLIDVMAFAWYPITILRAVAVPGWEDKVSIPLTTDRVFPSGSQHRVIAPNKVIELREDRVMLEKPFEGSCEVPFFRCIIATGASQPVPTTPDPSWSEDEFKAGLKKTQNDIRKATKVVVAGGGAVGIEIAGEMKAHYPDKHVTIVHKDIGLMSPTPCAGAKTTIHPSALSTEHGQIKSWSSPPTDLRLSREMERICDRLGIDVVLSDRVKIPPSSASPVNGNSNGNGDVFLDIDGDEDEANARGSEWDGTWGLQDGLKRISLESRDTLKADYIYPGCGMRPNSELVGALDKGALNGLLVAVDDHLKVVSTTPSSVFRGQYYAIGDVCNTPGFKIAHNAFASAHRAAANIINEIKGKALIKFNPGSAQGISVPIGPHEGAGQMTLPWFGTWVMGSRMIRLQRGKTSGTERFFAGRFKGSTKTEIRFDDLASHQSG